MNEEHRQFAFPDLIQRRSFLEVPAVFRVAQPAGGVHQRERRQPELSLQLVGEFIPDAGITAIFHKTFHKRLLRLTGYHHSGGGTHRDAMYYHLGISAVNIVGNVHPAQNVQPVFPTHLNGRASA